MKDHRIGSGRITSHPILPPLPEADIEFSFNGRTLKARRGEVTALLQKL